jgi:hypothetical protein
MKFEYMANAFNRGYLQLLVGSVVIGSMHVKAIIRTSDQLQELVVESYSTASIEQANAILLEALKAGALNELSAYPPIEAS